MTIAAEIGDLRRFATAKQLMAYVGLVPSEHSSGKRTQRGSITKTGNKHMCAAFWWKRRGITWPAAMSQAPQRNKLVSGGQPHRLGQPSDCTASFNGWSTRKASLAGGSGTPSPGNWRASCGAIGQQERRWPVERAQAAAARPEPRSPMSQPFSSRTNEHDRLMTTHNETSEWLTVTRSLSSHQTGHGGVTRGRQGTLFATLEPSTLAVRNANTSLTLAT
ncbi:MAG: transposase [Planctomycetaceae bacterium]